MGSAAQGEGDGGVEVGHVEDRRRWHRRFRDDAGVDDAGVDDAPTGDSATWTAEECAAAWGVKTATWLGYVSRGQAPQPLRERDGSGRRRWDPEAVRTFARPGPGRSRRGTGTAADELLAEMGEVAARMAELRDQQRALLVEGRQRGLEIKAMADALGISRQTAYSWLDAR
jgi:LmbE family N-acetylglucosaminyl deacetylase